MEDAGVLACPWIVGPGRMGTALATRLGAVPEVRRVILVGRTGSPTSLELAASSVVRHIDLTTEEPSERPTFIVLAVPDGAILDVARDLATRSLPPVPVLHTSGALGREVLAPLSDSGHPVGSMHPLVSVPQGAGAGSKLDGAWFGVEGDAVAVGAARAIVAAFGGRILLVDAGLKERYHAASVFASNFVVALLGVAAGLMADSGVDEASARLATTELAAGAVANVADLGPVNALTGPVSRGDIETVRLHLGGLSANDRTLYSVLASEVLSLARRQGLHPAAADQIAEILDTP